MNKLQEAIDNLSKENKAKVKTVTRSLLWYVSLWFDITSRGIKKLIEKIK